MLNPTLGVIEPLIDKLHDHWPTVLGDQLLQATLGDSSSAECGKVVAVPHIGNPDAPPTHPDDVLDIGITLLDSDARKIQPSLFVEIVGVGHVRGGLGVPTVSLMS